ncbi:MAG: patatin-like protein [Syntrophales bacterium]|nr:patatin-like protein [Syntrophales bacterium]
MNQTEYHDEKRFAVVMYGGVSLAIYINGVSQELYRMVRATADHQVSAGEGSERVYREIAGKLKTRFVVDILSGTSAGGINAIFLAKAFANGQSIKSLEKVWMDQGDIEVLINDAKSKDGREKSDFEYPRSLLNSERMYVRLLDALNDMDKVAPGKKTQETPFVKELDLYVTATDLQGFPTSLLLADQLVAEKKHKNVFHFQFGKGENGDNDFDPGNNPFLAFAARCTSSFPFAFEPMRLADVPCGIDVEKWQKFYAQYLIDPVQCREQPSRCIKKTKEGQYDVFSHRAFADGGYLDNKPFSYAINAINSRSSDIPVDRKLIYIEPTPEDVPSVFVVEDPPNAVENIAKVYSLATYETIREDLQRIIDRNRLIERVNRILKGTSDDIFFNQPEAASVKQWMDSDLDKMIADQGIAYGGYLRLRIAQLTDDMANMIAAQAGFDVESDDFLAMRYLVRAWRDLHYDYYEPDKASKDNFNQFLKDYDLSFYIRRLNYTIANIDAVFKEIDLDGGKKEAKRRTELSDRLYKVIAPVLAEREFREHLKKIRKELSQRREILYVLRTRLEKPHEDNEVTQAIFKIDIDMEEMKKDILSGASETDRYEAAQRIVQGKNQSFMKIAKIVSSVVEEADKHADLCKVLLGLGTLKKNGKSDSIDGALRAELESLLRQRKLEEAKKITLTATELTEGPPSGPADPATWLAAFFFKRFMYYDLVAYPILQFSGTGEELDPVEIIRISPNDANHLSNKGVRKLGGTALMHFGAFFDRTWRKNDILWGRLDGAERIIKALLSGTPHVAETQEYIKKAHIAILEEIFLNQGANAQTGEGPSETQETIDLLAIAALGRSERDRKNNSVKVSKVLGEDAHQALSNIIKEKLNNTLDVDKIYDLFKGYEANHDINPRLALESIARSTQVIGKMLGVMSEQYRKKPLKGVGEWLARFGQFAWGLVEAAVPESFYDLMTKKWISLLTLISVLLIGSNAFIDNGSLLRFGIFLLFAAAGLSLIKSILRGIILEKSKTVKWVWRLIVGTFVAAIAVLAGIGFAHFPEMWGRVVGWLLRLL